MRDMHLHLPVQTTASALPFSFPYGWRGLVCTSREEEWPRILHAMASTEGMAGAIGLLPFSPWDMPLQAIIMNMERLLRTHPDLQVGEVGLDRRYQDIVPLEKQREFLAAVLDISFTHSRSVSCENIFFEVLTGQRSRLPRLLWHGFTSSVETAQRFTALGGILSLGPSLWRPGLRLIERLKELRDVPFVIETDWPSGWLPEPWRKLPYHQILDNHTTRLSEALDIPRECLEERIDACGSILTDQ